MTKTQIAKKQKHYKKYNKYCNQYEIFDILSNYSINNKLTNFSECNEDIIENTINKIKHIDYFEWNYKTYNFDFKYFNYIYKNILFTKNEQHNYILNIFANIDFYKNIFKIKYKNNIIKTLNDIPRFISKEYLDNIDLFSNN